MQVSWTTRSFEALSSLELYQLLQLRIRIFMLEQECLYEECDDKDLQAKHLLGKINGKVVAYARILPKGISYPDVSIGRVVVQQEYRHLKLGLELMAQAIKSAHADYPNETIRISAQAHLQHFYEKQGFVRESDSYLEDNIPHIEMALYSN